MSGSGRLMMKNTLLLSGGNILLRTVGLCFQMYLAGKIGAGGLGIYGLIASVYTVFATISISGVRFAVTRLTSEEIGYGNMYPHKIVRCASCYALFFGTLSFLVLFFASPFIAQKWICHAYAELPLKLLSFSLPFVSMGAVFEGYFTAKQKILRLVSVGLLNQVVRIFSTVYLLNYVSGAKKHPCDVLSLSTLIAEVICSIISFALYFLNTFGKRSNNITKNAFPRLVSVAIPLAVSAYMKTGLSSLGHIIIPYGFRQAGMGSDGAFATYGVITQMAFPILMFPAALLASLGEILIPRLTSAQVNNQKVSINYIVSRATRIGFIFSIAICGFMFFYPHTLSRFCKNAEATLYIRVFAPLIPIMYCDSVTDGCLKGLGQQLYCMILNIAEAVINIVLLLVLLPRYAIIGYIATMYIKETFNTVLSFRRLYKKTAFEMDARMFLTVLCSAVFAFPLSYIAFGTASFLCGLFYIVVYLTLLYIFNSATRGDIKWILSLCK